MAPLGSQPAVVEVEPSDHGANVESTVDWVEHIWRTRHTRAIGDSGALDDGAEEFGARGEFEGAETAANGVEKDEAGSINLSNSVSRF